MARPSAHHRVIVPTAPAKLPQRAATHLQELLAAADELFMTGAARGRHPPLLAAGFIHIIGR
jgi:hypothetical protein